MSCYRALQRSSGQDGGIGRNPLLPHTTKRRITTNLKSINNQKCQKVKLHGTLTTKELKKKLTSKAADLVGRLRKTARRWQTLGVELSVARLWAVWEGLT